MKSLKVIFALVCFTFFFSCSDELNHVSNSENAEIEVRQMQSEFEPAPCSKVSTLKIFISDDCGSEWQDGLTDAILAYNDTNTGINMSDTPVESEADIIISCVDFANSNRVAVAEGPYGDESIGEEVFLNTDFEGHANPCYYQAILMHELGHTLGMSHNEAMDGQSGFFGEVIFNDDGTFTLENNASVKWIPGTTEPDQSDSGSIFNQSIKVNTTICDFNVNDIFALETLFPRPEEAPCDCPNAFTASEYEEFVNPCGCPEEYEPCACEEGVTITFPNYTGLLGCIPANSNITVCAEFPGSTPEDVSYEWGFTGSTPLGGPTQISGNSHSADNCTNINVGTGGTVSLWIENGDCSFSVSKELNMCPTTTVLPPGLNLHITP